METLWSPWRMAYIEDDKEDRGCLFCEQLEQPDSSDNLILHRGEHAFVILNRFPYTSGHLMVVPYEHNPSLEGLDDVTLLEVMTLVTRALTILRQTYGAQGFNVGVNIGEAAGAGILGHAHIHVVPRWAGDTNFMSTTASTRVLPEALPRTYERLRSSWDTDTEGTQPGTTDGEVRPS